MIIKLANEVAAYQNNQHVSNVDYIKPSMKLMGSGGAVAGFVANGISNKKFKPVGALMGAGVGAGVGAVGSLVSAPFIRAGVNVSEGVGKKVLPFETNNVNNAIVGGAGAGAAVGGFLGKQLLPQKMKFKNRLLAGAGVGAGAGGALIGSIQSQAEKGAVQRIEKQRRLDEYNQLQSQLNGGNP